MTPRQSASPIGEHRFSEEKTFDGVPHGWPNARSIFSHEFQTQRHDFRRSSRGSPGDPRFVAAVQRAATQRERDESEELGRRILSQTQTMGFTLKESWASPREWATKNNARPPGWVHPSATIELWTREGAAFCVVFRHEGKSELYECHGDQPFRNWRRIL